MEYIASRQNEWIKLARYFGADDHEVEDVVQNFYLKIVEMKDRDGNLDRITHYSGGINSIYIFKIIQTCTIDVKRELKRSQIVEEPEDEMPDPELIESEYEKLMAKIKDVIDGMNDYDIMMLELHFVFGHSMREIEKRTGIPTHSVFNTLKNAKNKIKNEAKKEYKSYCEVKNDQSQIAWTWGHDREDHPNDGN